MTTPQALAVAAIVIIAVVAVIRFELFCLRDLSATADAQLQYLSRSGWVAAIVCVVPIGGIAYLYLGKPR